MVGFFLVVIFSIMILFGLSEWRKSYVRKKDAERKAKYFARKEEEKRRLENMSPEEKAKIEEEERQRKEKWEKLKREREIEYEKIQKERMREREEAIRLEKLKEEIQQKFKNGFNFPKSLGNVEGREKQEFSAEYSLLAEYKDDANDIFTEVLNREYAQMQESHPHFFKAPEPEPVYDDYDYDWDTSPSQEDYDKLKRENEKLKEEAKRKEEEDLLFWFLASSDR